MITESVEIPRPLREAYERWTRDETIPAAMRRAEHPTEGDPGGDGAEIAWSERNDAPGRTGRVTFAAASERSTTITVELEPEPESEGGGDAGPRARACSTGSATHSRPRPAIGAPRWVALVALPAPSRRLTPRQPGAATAGRCRGRRSHQTASRAGPPLQPLTGPPARRRR
jgi:hypothetical protein